MTGKENPQKPANREFIKRDIEFDWTIETQEGTITFKSVGFKQYVRTSPKLMVIQKISLADRGGISFDKVSV